MHLLSDEGVSEVLVLTKVFWKYLISDYSVYLRSD